MLGVRYFEVDYNILTLQLYASIHLQIKIYDSFI